MEKDLSTVSHHSTGLTLKVRMHYCLLCVKATQGLSQWEAVSADRNVISSEIDCSIAVNIKIILSKDYCNMQQSALQKM
jgi:hypothetical protein